MVSAYRALAAEWTAMMAGFAAILMLLIAWTILQMVPLPYTLWSQMSGRAEIVQGLQLLGISPDQPRPISVQADQTFTAMLGFLPPIAVFFLFLAVGWRSAYRYARWLIPGLGVASVGLGLGQITSGAEDLYLYEITNQGSPVGLFANANHQATFLLMCLPFTANLANRERLKWRTGEKDIASAVLIATVAIILLSGIVAAGSLAGYGLLVPVLMMCVMLVRSGRSDRRGTYLSVGVVAGALVLAILTVGASPLLGELGLTSLSTGETSRLGMWATSTDMLSDHIGLGSGLGTFAETYPLYEDPSTVQDKFINAAHNDYLQLAIEWGLMGVALVALALVLWIVSFIQVWMPSGRENIQARRVASAAMSVVLLHSLVDYPIRTPAIAALFAFCLAVMLVPAQQKGRKSKNRGGGDEERSGAHLTL